MPKSSRTPAAKTLYHGHFLDLVSRNNWEFARRPNRIAPVGIIALTPDNKILLVSQFRIPVNKTVIEIPAGLIGDSHGPKNDSWRKAAKRELLEETGWTATSFQKLTHGPTSAGLTSECVTLVRALNLKHKGPQQLDPNEKITLHEIPLPHVPAWLKSQQSRGRLIDPKVWAALYFLNA